MNNDRFLPIGSVVKLKNCDLDLIITSYCIVSLPDNRDEATDEKVTKDKVYDYGAYPYPQGILEPKSIILFNRDKIDKVVFLGYETHESNDYLNAMKEALDNFN